MKILFVTKGDVDYLSDTIFIGLVKNGHDVTDTKFRKHLCALSDDERYQYYGKAFTIGNTLSSDMEFIDRTFIKEKIESKYFDIIIYGNVFRCLDYFDIVSKIYSRKEIIFLDGDDARYINYSFVEKGVYFKREKLTDDKTLPISFSFPKEKFYFGDFIKERFQSFIDPEDRSTYIYNNEEEYYNDYRKSLFGVTRRKAGWDCLRHYEIVANGCLPFFPDYENKPVYTMTNWPSELQAEANNLYVNCYSAEDGRELTQQFLQYAYENLTCEAVSEKMINKI